MKKVLIITTVSGFLYKFEMDNVKILQDLGYEVHYAANRYVPNYIYDEEELVRRGVIFHHIDIAQSPFERKMNKKALGQIIDIIEKEDIKLIHCHTPVGGVLGRLAGKKCAARGVKVIYTTHGFHFYKGAPKSSYMLFYMAEKYLAKSTDVIITINSEDYSNARKFRMREGGMVYKIPGVGIDLEAFKPMSDEEKRSARQMLGISPDTFFLLSVGEFSRNKNHITVIKMLKKMKDEKTLGDLKYGICGDGYYREELIQTVEKLGLSDVVTFFGYRTPVQPVLGCADAFIFPSRREGLGMAAIEALAMGVPVIAADNRGTREYMIPEENGYICAWDDCEAYKKNLETIRNLSPERLRKMKEYCRSSVEQFDKKNTVLIMSGIYERTDRQLWK